MSAGCVLPSSFVPNVTLLSIAEGSRPARMGRTAADCYYRMYRRVHMVPRQAHTAGGWPGICVNPWPYGHAAHTRARADCRHGCLHTHSRSYTHIRLYHTYRCTYVAVYALHVRGTFIGTSHDYVFVR